MEFSQKLINTHHLWCGRRLYKTEQDQLVLVLLENILCSDVQGALAAPNIAQATDTECRDKMEPQTSSSPTSKMCCPQVGIERHEQSRASGLRQRTSPCAALREEAHHGADVLSSDVQQTTRPISAPPFSNSPPPPNRRQAPPSANAREENSSL